MMKLCVNFMKITHFTSIQVYIGRLCAVKTELAAQNGQRSILCPVFVNSFVQYFAVFPAFFGENKIKLEICSRRGEVKNRKCAQKICVDFDEKAN